MGEWKSRSLGEIVSAAGGEIKTGPFGSQLHAYEYTDDPDGVPVVMPKDMVDGRVSRETVSRVSETTAQRLNVHRLVPGDLVLARRGDIGRLAFVAADEEGWICGTGSMRIHAPDHSVLDPQFLRYAMSAPAVAEWLGAQAVGATMKNLNADIVAAVPITVPGLGMQRKIAGILSALDKLVEANKRRIWLLENLARALYREWFVNLRFPGQSDNEVPNPKGWDTGKLGDIAELSYGKALPAPSRIPGDVSVVSSAGIIDNHDAAIVTGPGIVIGRKGNVGTVWWVEGDFFPIDTTYYIESEIPMGFLYWFLRDVGFIDSHAAVPGLSREQALAVPITIPPIFLLERFSKVHERLFRQISALRGAISKVHGIREVLLPRLVTGQLDISDIDLGVLTPSDPE